MGLQYRRELDGLRGIAVLLVVAFHSGGPAFGGGQQGVDLFFVLSGYLITRLLADMGLATFWSRRFLRLFPALAALVVAYVLAAPLFGWGMGEAALAATYSRNLPLMFGGKAGPLLHTWSLAAEAQFYFVWPFLLPLVRRRPLAILLATWTAVTVGRMAYRCATGDEAGAYYSPLLHSSGLILGAACAFAPRLAPRWSYIGAALIAMHLVAAPLGLRLWPLVEVGTALVICAPSGVYRALSWRPAVRLGLISYGVYLWHFPVAAILHGTAWWLSLAAMLLISVPMGALSYLTVEKLRRWPTSSGRLQPEGDSPSR